jgi:ubiquinol-cytochrome c reductase cytochrome b subunit
LGAVPVIGENLVEFVRGGKQVGPHTLGRFFVLHVTVIPAAIAALVAGHIFLLKRTGISTPPFGLQETKLKWQGDCYRHEAHPGGIPFFPNYFLQDMTSVLIYLAIFLAVVFFNPFIFFPIDAFEPANPFQTPAHIKPEWYFLPNYQVLKIFPNELIGLAVQGVAMTFLALVPFVDITSERHPLKRPLFMCLAVSGIAVYIALMIWGHFS